jgi:TM2 domain-containing membrane protein YozV
MKRSTKAVLLSGLVFPGLGHLYLKQWMAGILLFGIAACASGYIGTVVMETATVIVEKIQSGAVTPDIDTITRLAADQSSGTKQATNLAKIVWLACWVIGIVGSWWQGRAQDKPDLPWRQ